MSILDPFLEFIRGYLTPYSAIPDSTFFILAVACTLSVITTSVNRLLVNVKRIKSVMKEVNAWREELNKAKKSNDQQKVAKAMKKQQPIMKLQSKMMWDRMKVSFIFLAPFWIIFMVLSGFYAGTVVAFSPFRIPFLLSGNVDPQYGGTEMPFFSWYIISSFAVSLPLSRIFGINPED